MDAKIYLRELVRLTEKCNMDCEDCRLFNNMEGGCDIEDECNVDIIEQWAKDCPADTVLDVFKRHYPNFKKDKFGSPQTCPNGLNARYEQFCESSFESDYDCVACWNQPAIVEPQKEPRKEPLIIESECHVCKYTCKNPDEWPCKVCSNAYTNEFRIREVE